MGKGGGGGVVVGYLYNLSIHKALCYGPIDKVSKVLVDEKLAWAGEGTNGSHYIDQEWLFGGPDKEGGIKGVLEIIDGSQDQPASESLKSYITPAIPAFRGVACVLLNNMYVGTSSYMKKWWYRTQRIHKRSGGKPQWQPELAEINVYGAVVKPAGEEWEYVLIPQSDDLLPPYPEKGWLPTISPLAGSPSGSDNWKPYNTIWAKKTIQLDPFRPIIITGQVENGAHFFINGVHLFSINGENEDIKEREFFVKYIDTRQFPKGSNELQVCGLDEFPPIPNSSTYLDFSVNVADSGAMNPAHIIRECLTDVEWGMGYPEADMDEPAFLKAAVQLFNEGLGMCILWDQQQELQDFIGDVLRHIDGTVYIDRNTGKFVLKLIRDDWKEDSSEILHLDENSVESVSNFKRPTFGELVNSVTVDYWDMATGQDRSTTVTDIALSAQGGANATSIEFKGFPTAQIAERIAQRELSQLSTPLYTCSIIATTKADVLNIGDIFELSWSDFGLDRVKFRVRGIAYGDGKTNKVRIDATEDNFESPFHSTVTEQYPEWDDPDKPVKPIENFSIYESTYYQLVFAQGQEIVSMILSENPEAGVLTSHAERSSNAQIANLLVDELDGKGFDKRSSVFFGASFKTAQSVGKLETEIEVKNANGFTSFPTWGLLGGEFISVTSIENDVAKITRGCLDTPPQNHLGGLSFIEVKGFSNSDEKLYTSGDVVDAAMQAVGFSTIDGPPGKPTRVKFYQRALRPYLPGRLTVDGVLYPNSVPIKNLEIEFVGRNRLQQTGDVLINFHDGNIEPEVGATTVVEVFSIEGASKTLVESFNLGGLQKSNIDLSKLKFPDNAKYGILEVWAVRGGLKSYLPYSIRIDLLDRVFNLNGKYNTFKSVFNLNGYYE